MMCDGIVRPVALNRAQLLGGVADRGDRNVKRVAPDVGAAGHGSLRPVRQDKMAVNVTRGSSQLLLKLGKKAFGGEIAGELGQVKNTLVERFVMPPRSNQRGRALDGIMSQRRGC